VLTDTHCHLDLDKFDSDREAVLERAARAGVEHILIPGITLASSLSAVKLAGSHPMLFAAVGIHPTEAGRWNESSRNELRVLAGGSLKVVAIGEIGLDYYWNTAPHDIQRSVLKEQLDLAAELELPVIIHFREKGDACDGPCALDLLEILEQWSGRLERGKSPLRERPGVLHSFSGSRATAERALRLNFHLGVTGPITYRKERQELIAGMPLEHLLIETDSPFLAPHPQRGKRNEPAYVRLIADKMALLHARELEEVAAITSKNARKLFGWKETL
jgi:TatD DNase family protein